MQILKQFSEVDAFVEAAQQNADQHREALGFLPKSAYRELAEASRLWIAIEDGRYLGHLAFGGTYPQIRIFQLLVQPEGRGRGVGSCLVNDLVQEATNKNYVSITADVAADLAAANAFWASQGFKAVKQKQGGASRNRKIILRARLLKNFSLLDQASLVDSERVLRVPETRVRPVASYALDINVLLDLVHGRADRDDAAALLARALSENFKIFFTTEAKVELNRNNGGVRDPAVAFLLESPVLPDVSGATLSALSNQLASEIFLSGREKRELSTREQSDVRHLAIAIHHGLSGFVTRDGRLLRCAAWLQRNFKFDVVTPSDFRTDASEQNYQNEVWVHGNRAQLQISRFTERERADTENYLRSFGLSAEVIQSLLSPGTTNAPAKRFLVREQDALRGFATWRAPILRHDEVTITLLVNPECSQQAAVCDFFTQMLETQMLDAGSAQLLRIQVPHDTPALHRALLETGFQRAADQPFFAEFARLISPGVVQQETWSLFRTSAAKFIPHELPRVMPSYRNVERDGVLLNGESNEGRYVDLSEFEAYFAPVLFLFPSRSGVLVPIRDEFAKELLRLHEEQMNLMWANVATLRRQKAYFRNAANAAKLRAGMPVLFYESKRSGGLGRVVGCARSTYSDLLSVNEALVRFQDHGVLGHEALKDMANEQDMLHVFAFEAFQPFRRPVMAEFLKSSGLGRSNFQTIETVSAEQLKSICLRGFDLE